MAPEHQTAINGLLIFVGVLTLAIFLPFILKAFKKPPHETLDQNAGTRADESSASILPRGSFVDVTPASEAEMITEEKKTEKSHAVKSPEVATEFNLSHALKNTQNQIFGRLSQMWKRDSTLDQNIDILEEVLYTSDLGPKTVESLLSNLRTDLKKMQTPSFENLQASLRTHLMEFFAPVKAIDAKTNFVDRLNKPADGPCIMMIVGINGAGKTTTIGKLSSQLAQKGFKVLVAAGDTFRAAAGEQLRVWTERAQVEIFAPQGVLDPSGVAFDAVAKGRAQNFDYVIIDTAGRLHTQAHLMEELKKVKRVVQKQMPEAPHEILLVVDSNSGQNALLQGVEFNAALGLTGVVMTKLDGTAKGGVAVGLVHELQVPIKFIGVGEKIQDLRVFDHQAFVNSLIAQNG